MSALRLSLGVLLLAFCPVLPAQTPRTLGEMEAIYHRELSELHIPLISRYLIELQRQAAVASDKSAWQSEIVRVQELLKSGGVIDLSTARAALDNVAAPLPPPLAAVPPRAAAPAAIVLAPPKVARVGQFEWSVEFAAAGAYDVHVQYACPAIPADLTLRVEFEGQSAEVALDSSRLTQDDKTFRLLRIGQITVPADARGKTLRFVSGDKSSTALLLKQLFLIPATPAVAKAE